MSEGSCANSSGASDLAHQLRGVRRRLSSMGSSVGHRAWVHRQVGRASLAHRAWVRHRASSVDLADRAWGHHRANRA
eukprot:151458-Prymnesium_polylepis.1